MDSSVLRHAADKIARITARPLDVVALWQETTEVLATAVPFYGSPCWYTVDPASLLITSHFNDELAEFPPEWLTAEYYYDDVNKISEVAASETGLSTLRDATGGDPTGSRRWQQNIRLGGDQELIAGLRTRTGEVWGAVGLYREPGSPLFGKQEKDFLRAVSPRLAEAARRALLVGEATDPEGPDAPGLLILTESSEIDSATPGVRRRLDALPDGDLDAGRLPSAVLSVAARALRTASSERPGEVAMARVLSRGGTWVVLHGAALVSGGARRVAVIVEPAHPATIYPLLMSVYGLTDREREVTRLVLQGCSTAQIAAELVVSAHTVQQPPRPGGHGVLRPL